MNSEMTRWLTSFLHLLLTSAALFAAQGTGSPDAGSSPRRIHPERTEPAVTVADLKLANAASPTELPPAPAGVTEIKFSEFFRQPIGPRGLELTDKLRALAGQRVRILGYMVRQERPVARSFLLTPVPVTLHEDEYGFCESLPATALHVFTATNTPPVVPFTPGLLLLTGRLTVGNREEADGRISTVRLQLDAPTEGLDQTTNRPIAAIIEHTANTNSIPVAVERP